VQILQDVYCKN